MNQHKKIITVVILITLSLCNKFCFALVLSGTATTRNGYEAHAKEIGGSHVKAFHAELAMSAHEARAKKKAAKASRPERQVSHEGLNQARDAKVSRLIEARATHVKASIKKLGTTEHYTEQLRDADAAKIDDIKTQFINAQSEK